MSGKEFLKENNAEQYALDAEIIMMKVTGFTKVQLFTKNDYILNDEQADCYGRLLNKRALGVPTQYITGECEFMGLYFSVNESVLIPRPDTEILVETALDYIKKYNLKTIIDIGTGSGCIPVSLAKYSDIKAYAIDISHEALQTAINNADINNVSEKITFIESNMFENVPSEIYGNVDSIISNPPYIPSDDISGLMREVKDNEPLTALDGGKDGLDFYRILTKEGKKLLRYDGFMFFEIGCEQAQEVCRLMKNEGFEDIVIINDLAGLERVVCGRNKFKII